MAVIEINSPQLKTLKKHLRSQISSNSLVYLTRILIEKQIINDFDTENLIKDFASLKDKRVNFKLEILLFLMDFSKICLFTFDIFSDITS